MGETTAVTWTHSTFNAWWGCERVSPACTNCYAEAFAKRTGHDVWGKGGDRRFFGDKHWAEPLKWDRAAEASGLTHLVFCASMSDVFEDRDDLLAERAKLWALIEATPHLTWQLLTKRPQHVRAMVPARWLEDWPANVWMGTTVEDQRRAFERVPRLLEIPAGVRFLSCEPLLQTVDLSPWLRPPGARKSGISWIICGGESGPGHRPLELDRARNLRDQCLTAEIPFFFKQVGGHRPTSGGDELDGRTWHQFPAGIDGRQVHA